MELDKKTCPIIDVDGFLEKGKQFDLDIILPEDERNVIYGIVKDCRHDPIENAVVKLIEVCKEYGKEERKPVTHTFTDKDGQFVFGPLCPDRYYEIEIWVNKVKHYKVCAMCKHEGKCLKGVDMDCCEFEDPCKDRKEHDYKKEDDYKKDDYKEDEHKKEDYR